MKKESGKKRSPAPSACLSVAEERALEDWHHDLMMKCGDAEAPTPEQFLELGPLSRTVAGALLQLQERLEKRYEDSNEASKTRQTTVGIRRALERAGQLVMERFTANDHAAFRQIADVLQARGEGMPIPEVRIRREGVRRRKPVTMERLMPPAILNVVRRRLSQFSQSPTIMKITETEIGEELNKLRREAGAQVWPSSATTLRKWIIKMGLGPFMMKVRKSGFSVGVNPPRSAT